ncbi:hypothetical protein PENTCL1PPCAC_27145, partial [Pristionchus entomophagus]
GPRSPLRRSLPSPSLTRMTPLLLLGWIAAVTFLLLTCKKKAKTDAKESTCTEGTKKSNPQSKEVQEHNAKINAGMKRPQKDDETVDDQNTDWGQPQKVDIVADPTSLKPDSVNSKATKVDSKKG